MKTAVCLRLAPIALLLAIIEAPTDLHGQSVAKSSGATSDAAIGIRLSTLGLGLELGKQLGDHISARVGINFGSFSQNGKKQTDLTYDVSLKLKAAEALIDYSPSKRGVFHFTAGLLTNPLTISGVGTPSGSGTFTINGNTYTRAQVGTLSTTSKFPGAMPYLGLGFGTPANRGGRVKFLFDLGAAIGKPTVALTSTGAASNATLQADLNAQTSKTQKDLNKLAAYPVISLGLAIHL